MVYKRNNAGETLIVGVYVDDLIVTGTSAREIKEFKHQMMRDLGLLAYYLDIEVEQREQCITLKQSSYAKKILLRVGMSERNPSKFPMEQKLKLGKDEGGEVVNPTEYRSIIGSLRYLTHTQSDLAYAVGMVSRYMEKPTKLHLQAVKQTLRYVQGAIDFGLVYTKGRINEKLVGYTDSNIAGDTDDRKSISDMAFYFCGNLIAWASQKQKSVALSSCEAEFMAVMATVCEGIWLSHLLSELTGDDPNPVTLYVDKKPAIALMKNPVFHGRSKHMNTRFHFIHECVEKGQILVKYVGTEGQHVDILTKALAQVKYGEMSELLGVKNLAQIKS